MCYTTDLQSAKLLALQTLTALLATTEDPVEKRRIATTILRIPDPRATGSPGALTGQPVLSTPDSHTTRISPSPKLPTQDPAPSTQDSSSPFPHPPSDIPNPTFLSLPPLSDIESRLAALDAELQHHLEHLLTGLPLTPLQSPHAHPT